MPTAGFVSTTTFRCEFTVTVTVTVTVTLTSMPTAGFVSTTTLSLRTRARDCHPGAPGSA